MFTVHNYEEMTPEKRPQDPNLDGEGCTFETMEHGGKYPDTMPQAIKMIDAEGRSAIYTPITAHGEVVDSIGFHHNSLKGESCWPSADRAEVAHPPSECLMSISDILDKGETGVFMNGILERLRKRVPGITLADVEFIHDKGSTFIYKCNQSS
jgi:hypothetical protein